MLQRIHVTRGGRDDRLAALEIGADDYMVKPFDPQEMALRIGNLVARAKGGEVDGKSVAMAFGGFRFDARNRTLSDADDKAGS